MLPKGEGGHWLVDQQSVVSVVRKRGQLPFCRLAYSKAGKRGRKRQLHCLLISTTY